MAFSVSPATSPVITTAGTQRPWRAGGEPDQSVSALQQGQHGLTGGLCHGRRDREAKDEE